MRRTRSPREALPRKGRASCWVRVLTVVALAGAAIGTAAAQEAQMYGVTDWTSACSATDLDYWDDMVDFWYDEITDSGFLGLFPRYSRDRRYVNGSISRNFFCDPDTGLSGCQDYNYADEGDAITIFAHGFDGGNFWGAVMRNPASGDCSIDGNEMYMGDVDAEFLHLSSCQSMDDDNLPYAWQMMQDPYDSPGNGRRLHQMTGFHGLMWIGGCCDDQYEDFADDAFWVSIKDAWMDNQYVTGINGSSTQCPVAYAIGVNSSDCFFRLGNERYNRVFSDPGPAGYYCYSYYAGCDPEGETPWGTD